jgi:hypothetical protein
MQHIGYIENELCNRNGCRGTLKRREWWHDGPCTCHLGRSALCSSCISAKTGCCPICEWNKFDSTRSRVVLFEKTKIHTIMIAGF